VNVNFPIFQQTQEKFMPQEKHKVDPAVAHRIMRWLRERGGIAIWGSVNLSNPGKTWTAPVNDDKGQPKVKESWEMGEHPIRIITDPAEVLVVEGKVYKRFHVAVRPSGNGLSLKVSDGGSRRLRMECQKAKEKCGDSWYEFDYGSFENAVIFVPGESTPLWDWIEKHPEGN
jgi:hypothetical protein